MKLSLAITALILVGFAALGWRQQAEVNRLSEQQAALQSKALALGLAVEAVASGQTTRSRHADRSRAGRAPQDVKAVAADVARLLKDIKDGSLDTEEQSGVERISALVERIYQLDAAQIRILLDEFRRAPDLDDDGRRGVVGFAILTLAETHPEAAIGIYSEAHDLLKVEEGRHGEDVLRKLLGTWAAKDPLAALDWMKKNDSLNPDLLDPGVYHALIAGAARRDPALAFELVAGLKGSDLLGTTLEIIKTARTPDAQREMLALLRGLPARVGDDPLMEKTYASAFGALAKGMIEQGYAATQSWLSAAKLTPQECQLLAANLSSTKPAADSGQWLEWMGRNLPPDQLGFPTNQLMNRWTTEDYRAAGDWLAATPDSAVKPAAVASYAITVARYDPATAAQWGETLPAGPNRDLSLHVIYTAWWNRDPAAAAVFAAKHGIAPNPP